ncbi:E3 ubiquitin-protein ligase RFWD3 [Fopius arisanus]|uniref:RING-type E3 ubiquitin transferase n=2 Tax=Fopius arisanus TaxID=64838 RepID=A0A0C9R085_9HYME|nr:PREDICTED: E3 ubiquitin-protein ligase RFWD3-like [Fopius arisanus]
MEYNHNYLEVAILPSESVDLSMNIVPESGNEPDLGDNSSPSGQEEEEEDEYVLIVDDALMPVEIRPAEIIEAVDLENVGNIEIIENVENVANIMEVQAINENSQENAPEIIQVAEIPQNEDSTASSATSSSALESEEEKPRKKRKLEIEAKSLTQDSDESDEGKSCPICMEHWTNSGDHRLCSLACGHLFGHKCVLRWLKQECTAQNRRCPHCNRKAHTKDIRMIYTTNLSSVDTIELDRLKNELQTVMARNKSMESEISKSHLRYKIAQDRIKELTQKITDLETQRHDFRTELRERTTGGHVGRKFHLDRTFEMPRDGCGRVLDYNSWYGYLAVSQKSPNGIFPGYGVKKIDTHKYEQLQFTLLHSQQIRDMAFHQTQQSLLLSVSFDKTAKLMDIHNDQVLHGFPVESQVWSCCWAGDNPNIFVVGTQKGLITQFDIRQTAGALDTLESPGDRSPVASLATVPPCSSNGIVRGGFLASHLNSCYAYEIRNNVYVAKQMLHEGPFTCIRYDSQNHHALISCRPNANNLQARHIVFSVEKVTENTVACNTVHTFTAGSTQNLLSRPCHINFTDDTFVAAHQESTKSVPIWSVSTGKEVQRLPTCNPVVDLCSFRLQNSVFLGALSGNKLRLYNCEQP